MYATLQVSIALETGFEPVMRLTSTGLTVRTFRPTKATLAFVLIRSILVSSLRVERKPLNFQSNVQLPPIRKRHILSF